MQDSLSPCDEVLEANQLTPPNRSELHNVVEKLQHYIVTYPQVVDIVPKLAVIAVAFFAADLSGGLANTTVVGGVKH